MIVELLKLVGVVVVILVVAAALTFFAQQVNRKDRHE